MATMTGCVSRQNAVWVVAKSIVRPNASVNETPLRADLRYLRVTVGGKALLMVLGYVDRDKHDRPVEVWYSADGEVLRTCAGRLVGLSGTPVEWHDVRLPASMPAWPNPSSDEIYVRQLDEMPGYHWGRVDRMTVRPILPPGSSELESMPTGELQWFEESAEGRPSWSAARYALAQGMQDPVYGEQCLSETLCLSWQLWPPPRPLPASAPR